MRSDTSSSATTCRSSASARPSTRCSSSQVAARPRRSEFSPSFEWDHCYNPHDTGGEASLTTCSNCNETCDHAARFCARCGSPLPQYDQQERQRKESEFRLVDAQATKEEHHLPHYTKHERNRRAAWALAEAVSASAPRRLLFTLATVTILGAFIVLLGRRVPEALWWLSIPVTILAAQGWRAVLRERRLAARLRRLCDNDDPEGATAYELANSMEADMIRRKM